MADFLDWLQSRHDQIMDCEKKAYGLMKKDDIAGYKAAMKQKATQLAELYQEAAPKLAGLAGDKAKIADQTLRNFSGNAATALQLGSIFYMSALLYKDEHGKDEPDNLQLLINQLKK